MAVDDISVPAALARLVSAHRSLLALMESG